MACKECGAPNDPPVGCADCIWRMAWMETWGWWYDGRKWHGPEEEHQIKVFVEEQDQKGNIDRIFLGYKNVGTEPCGPGLSLMEAYQQNEWRIPTPR
jgi:hypothetical protein